MGFPKALHLNSLNAIIVNWGNVDKPIDQPISKMSGFLLNKDVVSETGYWECTEGKWQCQVTRNEFCHFVDGECLYTSEDNEVIEITPGSIAFFPKDWRGICLVKKKIRKFYCIF